MTPPSHPIAEAAGFAAVMKDTTARFPSSTDYFSDRIMKSAETIHDSIVEVQDCTVVEKRKDILWEARLAIQDCAGLLDIAARQGFIDVDLRFDFCKQLNTLRNLVQELIRGSDGPEGRHDSIAATVV